MEVAASAPGLRALVLTASHDVASPDRARVAAGGGRALA
jgi:hypothetical protein